MKKKEKLKKVVVLNLDERTQDIYKSTFANTSRLTLNKETIAQFNNAASRVILHNDLTLTGNKTNTTYDCPTRTCDISNRLGLESCLDCGDPVFTTLWDFQGMGFGH